MQQKWKLIIQLISAKCKLITQELKSFRFGMRSSYERFNQTILINDDKLSDFIT